MGCGSSTNKVGEEPLQPIVPQGFTANGTGGKSAPAPITLNGEPLVNVGSFSPIPAKPVRKLILYDPLQAPFPPSVASLQRKVAGRAPLVDAAFMPEWKRVTEVMTSLLEKQNQAAADGAEAPKPADEASAADAAPSDNKALKSVVFSDSIKEDNVIAGPYADPHIASVLISLAAFPNRVIRLFCALDEPLPDNVDRSKLNPYTNGIVMGTKLKSNSLATTYLSESQEKFAASIASGKFTLRLFYAGVWQTVQIDDSVPVSKPADGSTELPQLLFTSSRDHTEFWMCLVEKAIAKIKGSYQDICYSTPIELSRLLTGGSGEIRSIPSTCSVEQGDEIWSALLVSKDRNDLLSCSTRTQQQIQLEAVAVSKKKIAKNSDLETPLDSFFMAHRELGIDAFYSVLELQQLPADLGAHKLLLLRNPKGSQKWEGRWSEESDEWVNLEKNPDGAMTVAQLRMLYKKHRIAATRQGGDAGSALTTKQDGLFWISWPDFLVHFQAIFVCSVLADHFDHCFTQKGSWEGKSAAGKPVEEPQGDNVVINQPTAVSSSVSSSSSSSSANYGNFLHNPQFRIRNTAPKKSGPVTITLSKGSSMLQQTGSLMMDDKSGKAVPQPPVFIGFKVVTNQLNHAINCNAPTPSPMFGQLQVSPLFDEVLTSRFSSDECISVTIPFLESYKDYFLVPYTFDAGQEGDFVLSVYSNTASILFDACAAIPKNPIEFPVVWSKANGSAAGNIWVENYLHNPSWKIVNNGDDTVKLLLNMVKMKKRFADLNLNLRVLQNMGPLPLNATAIGTVNAPAKPTPGGGSRALAAPSASLAIEETKESAPATKEKKSSSKPLVPVTGVLSPFSEAVEGAGTRFGSESFYASQKSYPVIVANLVPNKEVFVVASNFTAGTEGDALLQIFGSNMEHVSVEPVTKEYHRSLAGRWHGIHAAGPARRKKTFLNNPQFCLRHQGAAPVSFVVSLLLPAVASTLGGAHVEVSVNITVASFAGSTDPNPFTSEEVDAERRRTKDAEKKRNKELELKRKKEEADKARLQGQVMGNSSAAASSSAGGNFGSGVASLRIKSKDAPNNKKDGKKQASNNMFGNLDAPAADAEEEVDEDTVFNENVVRVNPLQGSDFEIVTQTNFNGELYKQARLVHLFIPDVAPNRSYFVIPSTSLPAQESDFTVQIFGPANATVKFNPCYFNNVVDGTSDMNALASRRQSAALASSLASHKGKAVHKDGAKGTAAKPSHKKEKFR